MAGSVSAYFLYILPKIETLKIENIQLKEKRVEDLQVVGEEKPKDQSVSPKSKKDSQLDIKRIDIQSKGQETLEDVIPLVDPIPQKEDPAIIIERCKVNTAQEAKNKATKAKNDYVLQQMTLQNNCQSTDIDYNQYQLNLAQKERDQAFEAMKRAQEQGDVSAVEAYQGQIVAAQNKIYSRQNQISTLKSICMNAISNNAQLVYNQIYQQEYDIAYQQCIN